MRYLPLYIAAIVAILTSACNTSEPEANGSVTYNNVAVNSFNLQADDSVLVNLDSVYFSIDLVNRVIFNADSLPKGTRTDRLTVKVGTTLISNVEIVFPRKDGIGDTVVNYLTSPNDSIDFTRGPVSLRITSYDGTYVASYRLKVNVHTMEPDTLCWSSLAQATLPSALSAPVKQKAVSCSKGAVVLTTDASGAASVSWTPNPSGAWEKTRVTLPAGADVETFAAKGDYLYIIAAGKLWESPDMGATWTDTSVAMTWIYGACDGLLLGCNVAGSQVTAITYPATTAVAAPAGLPVSGTSNLVYYDSKWAESPMVVMVGGRKSDGSLTDATWAWTGGEWVRIDAVNLPYALEGMSLVPYYSFTVNKSNWKVKRTTTLLAWGGRDANNEVNDTVYMSIDRGIRWSMAPVLLQFPASMPAAYGAQALVYDTTLSAGTETRGGSGWTEVAPRRIPAWFVPQTLCPDTRAVAPVNSWECPYIYLFGGYDRTGKLRNNMWRGVINRLSFRPIY